MPRKTLTSAQLQSAMQMLQSLPPKQVECTTAKAAVAALSNDIAALQARGYSYSDIAQHLRTAGIAVSATTLRRYAPKRAQPQEQPQQASEQPQAQPLPF